MCMHLCGISESKIFKPLITKAKRKALINICKISFLLKDIELINVSHIFNGPSAKTCLHIDIRFCYPSVVYSLLNPIRSNILNFNKFIHNVGVKAFLQDNAILPCNCEAFDI